MHVAEEERLRKQAIKRCRNCLAAYQHQAPFGGRYTCSACGHVSRRPALDTTHAMAVPSKPPDEKGGMLNGMGDGGGSDAGSDNWDGVPALTPQVSRSNSGASNAAAPACAEATSSSVLLSALEFVAKKILGRGLCERARMLDRLGRGGGEKTGLRSAGGRDVAGDAGSMASLCQRLGRGEKTRRKMEEKRAARSERQKLEDEEKQVREEVAQLVEEQRRTRLSQNRTPHGHLNQTPTHQAATNQTQAHPPDARAHPPESPQVAVHRFVTDASWVDDASAPDTSTCGGVVSIGGGGATGGSSDAERVAAVNSTLPHRPPTPPPSADSTVIPPSSSPASTGSLPTGSASTGSVPTGSASTGSVPTGSASTGSVPTGSSSAGSSPLTASPVTHASGTGHGVGRGGGHSPHASRAGDGDSISVPGDGHMPSFPDTVARHASTTAHGSWDGKQPPPLEERGDGPATHRVTEPQVTELQGTGKGDKHARSDCIAATWQQERKPTPERGWPCAAIAPRADGEALSSGMSSGSDLTHLEQLASAGIGPGADTVAGGGEFVFTEPLHQERTPSSSHSSLPGHPHRVPATGPSPTPLPPPAHHHPAAGDSTHSPVRTSSSQASSHPSSWHSPAHPPSSHPTSTHPASQLLPSHASSLPSPHTVSSVHPPSSLHALASHVSHPGAIPGHAVAAPSRGHAATQVPRPGHANATVTAAAPSPGHANATVTAAAQKAPRGIGGGRIAVGRGFGNQGGGGSRGAAMQVSQRATLHTSPRAASTSSSSSSSSGRHVGGASFSNSGAHMGGVAEGVQGSNTMAGGGMTPGGNAFFAGGGAAVGGKGNGPVGGMATAGAIASLGGGKPITAGGSSSTSGSSSPTVSWERGLSSTGAARGGGGGNQGAGMGPFAGGVQRGQVHAGGAVLAGSGGGGGAGGGGGGGGSGHEAGIAYDSSRDHPGGGGSLAGDAYPPHPHYSHNLQQQQPQLHPRQQQDVYSHAQPPLPHHNAGEVYHHDHHHDHLGPPEGESDPRLHGNASATHEGSVSSGAIPRAMPMPRPRVDFAAVVAHGLRKGSLGPQASLVAGSAPTQHAGLAPTQHGPHPTPLAAVHPEHAPSTMVGARGHSDEVNAVNVITDAREHSRGSPPLAGDAGRGLAGGGGLGMPGGALPGSAAVTGSGVGGRGAGSGGAARAWGRGLQSPTPATDAHAAPWSSQALPISSPARSSLSSGGGDLAVKTGNLAAANSSNIVAASSHTGAIALQGSRVGACVGSSGLGPSASQPASLLPSQPASPALSSSSSLASSTSSSAHTGGGRKHVRVQAAGTGGPAVTGSTSTKHQPLRETATNKGMTPGGKQPPPNMTVASTQQHASKSLGTKHGGTAASRASACVGDRAITSTIATIATSAVVPAAAASQRGISDYPSTDAIPRAAHHPPPTGWQTPAHTSRMTPAGARAIAGNAKWVARNAGGSDAAATLTASQGNTLMGPRGTGGERVEMAAAVAGDGNNTMATNVTNATGGGATNVSSTAGRSASSSSSSSSLSSSSPPFLPWSTGSMPPPVGISPPTVSLHLPTSHVDVSRQLPSGAAPTEASEFHAHAHAAALPLSSATSYPLGRQTDALVLGLSAPYGVSYPPTDPARPQGGVRLWGAPAEASNGGGSHMTEAPRLLGHALSLDGGIGFPGSNATSSTAALASSHVVEWDAVGTPAGISCDLPVLPTFGFEDRGVAWLDNCGLWPARMEVKLPAGRAGGEVSATQRSAILTSAPFAPLAAARGDVSATKASTSLHSGPFLSDLAEQGVSQSDRPVTGSGGSGRGDRGVAGGGGGGGILVGGGRARAGSLERSSLDSHLDALGALGTLSRWQPPWQMPGGEHEDHGKMMAEQGDRVPMAVMAFGEHADQHGGLSCEAADHATRTRTAAAAGYHMGHTISSRPCRPMTVITDYEDQATRVVDHTEHTIMATVALGNQARTRMMGRALGEGPLNGDGGGDGDGEKGAGFVLTPGLGEGQKGMVVEMDGREVTSKGHGTRDGSQNGDRADTMALASQAAMASRGGKLPLGGLGGGKNKGPIGGGAAHAILAMGSTTPSEVAPSSATAGGSATTSVGGGGSTTGDGGSTHRPLGAYSTCGAELLFAPPWFQNGAFPSSSPATANGGRALTTGGSGNGGPGSEPAGGTDASADAVRQGGGNDRLNWMGRDVPSMVTTAPQGSSLFNPWGLRL
eukprot:jgi/Mesvir1/15839/Mv03388-RA.1